MLYSLKNPLNFVILPATHKLGTVTLMFYMELLMNYCFDTRHANIMLSHSSPTLGKFSLDHFSIRRSRQPRVLLHQCKLEWIFNNLDSIFPSLAGFWIPMAGFWIPKVIHIFWDFLIWGETLLGSKICVSEKIWKSL